MCFVCVWMGAAVFVLRENISESLDSRGIIFLERVVVIFFALNNSVNFLFYLRARSFRAAFVIRYLSILKTNSQSQLSLNVRRLVNTNADEL